MILDFVTFRRSLYHESEAFMNWINILIKESPFTVPTHSEKLQPINKEKGSSLVPDPASVLILNLVNFRILKNKFCFCQPK